MTESITVTGRNPVKVALLGASVVGLLILAWAIFIQLRLPHAGLAL